MNCPDLVLFQIFLVPLAVVFGLFLSCGCRSLLRTGAGVVPDKDVLSASGPVWPS
jgi:hypothetical protein